MRNVSFILWEKLKRLFGQPQTSISVHCYANLAHSNIYATITAILIPEHFYHPTKKPHAYYLVTPTPALGNRQPTFFLCGDSFRTFHASGIMQNVVLCDRLLPLSLMFPVHIHVVAWISSHPSDHRIMVHRVDTPHFKICSSVGGR